jgi:hypothetical protein
MGTEWGQGYQYIWRGPQYVTKLSVAWLRVIPIGLSCSLAWGGRAVYPGNPEEDVSSPGQTSQDDGPTHGHKVE